MALFSFNSSTEIAVFRVLLKAPGNSSPNGRKETHESRKVARFSIKVVQKSPFSEPLDSSFKCIPDWKEPQESRKMVPFQKTSEQKSPFSALLNSSLNQKLSPMRSIVKIPSISSISSFKIALPCGAS